MSTSLSSAFSLTPVGNDWLIADVHLAGSRDDNVGSPPFPGAQPLPVGRVSPKYTELALDNAVRDAELLRRIKTDDEEAFTLIVTEYASSLHDFAYGILRDSDTAADVVQDVLANVWVRRASLTVSGTVAEYLFRAVRNRVIDVMRRERTRAHFRATVGPSFIVDASTLADTSDAALITNEFAAAITAAVRSLTPRVRETLLLHKVHNLSYAEIASVLGVSIATVQGQLSRATRQIFEYLAPFR